MPASGMSATHVHVPSGLTEQPEFQITVDERGVWRITENFECPAVDLPNKIPAQYTAHGTYTFALLAEAVVNRVEGDIATVTRCYTGLRAEESIHTLEVIGGTSEDPIETHDRYKDLPQSEFAAIKSYCESPTNDDFTAKTKPSGLSSLGEELIDKKLKGLESYLNKGFTLRESWVARAFNYDLGAIGKIVVPPDGAPGGVTNWLLIDFAIRRIGGYYEFCADYRASGPAGWDTVIYS